MKLFKLALAAITLLFAASTIQAQSPEVVMGAARTDTYVPLLPG